MYLFDGNFEDIVLKITNISARPDLIGIEINNIKNKYYEFYIYDVYLDDHDESDVFDFSWEMCKQLHQQSKETQQTLKLIFG